MSSEHLTILILDSTRQALPFLRSLRKAGHLPIVACSTRLDIAYWSRYAVKRYMVPSPTSDFDGFCEAILHYVETHDVDVAMGLYETGARALSMHKERFAKHVRLAVPDWEVFQQAMDKGRTMRFCVLHEIPCPRTWLPSEQKREQILAEVAFPAIVKPRVGVGSLGVRTVNDNASLLQYLEALTPVYGDMLIQDYIGGPQCEAHAFVDAHGVMKACVVISKPRFFPVTGGTSTANETIRHPVIESTVRRLLEGMKWRGGADVDLILDSRDNVPKVIEVNPRIPANIKIAFEAGVDFADLTLRLAMGQEVPERLDYKLGVYCRNLVMDLLWYIYSDRQARKATPLPFWKFFGRHVTYQELSFRDPLPFFAFVIGMAKKYARRGAFVEKLGRTR
jgi:D-aspartate ligase